MSTITGSTQSAYSFTPSRATTGKNPLAGAIDSAVSSGTISKTDGTALTSALDSIGESLKGERAGGAKSAGAARLEPAQAQEKIEGLIDEQVASGNLTTEQADALKELFESAASSGAASSDATKASEETTTEAEAAKALIDSFLEILQQSQTKASGYAESGASEKSRSASALVLDFQA